MRPAMPGSLDDKAQRGRDMIASDITLPLEGTRVLELGHIVAGPTASLILADLGADVIKVENPEGGDQARTTGFGFVNTNRNKRSIALDLKAPRGKEVFLRLIRNADVCLDNYGADGLGRLPSPRHRRPGAGLPRRHLERGLGAVLQRVRPPRTLR